MKRPGTPGNSKDGQSRSERCYSYQKARDNRKHPIRGPGGDPGDSIPINCR